MALIQVPYNNAMRLGQGFNTYNQQICIDNAVVGMSNPEDSQPITGTPSMPIINTDAVVTEPTTDVVTTVPKESIAQIVSSVNTASSLQTATAVYPSQIVTYYSKYVDKLSDVSNTLNISASLSIQYGEIKGSGAGSFVDVDTFQNSDMNFLVSVNVINQTINVKDQLQFWPLSVDSITDKNPTPRNIKASDFTQVYGDSFISGFQEGGQFFAIVSIRALDSTKKTEIKASAQLALQVGVGSVEADGSVELAKQDLQKNSEVNITVNWSGGGQLKEGGEKWDIETLTEVAVRFPDLVAQCPQRTHAILTKYTALRGYLEWKARASTIEPPLNYELASLYTDDLLDVYMDYKNVWAELHTMLDVFDTGTAVLTKALEPLIPITAPKIPTDATKTKWVDGPQLHSFEPSVIGLDSAVQQCRLLMVRLVQEVNDIISNPSLAVDPNRPVAYLRPQLFRQLLPTMNPLAVLSGIFGMPALLFPAMDAIGPPTTQGAITIDGIIVSNQPQSVPVFYPPDVGTPNVVLGLSRLDMFRGPRPGTNQGSFRLCCGISASQVTSAGTKVIASLFPKPQGTAFSGVIPAAAATYALSAQPLVVASTSDIVQAGYFEGPWSQGMNPVNGLNVKSFSQSLGVGFQKRYATPPNVMVWLAGFDRSDVGDVCSVVASANSITTDGFKISISCPVGNIWQASISWIAVPSNAVGIACGNTPSCSTTIPTTWAMASSGHVAFADGVFAAPPKVYVAMNSFAFGSQNQLRLQTSASGVTAQGFDWSASAWTNGTQLIGASLGWIAIAS